MNPNRHPELVSGSILHAPPVRNTAACVTRPIDAETIQRDEGEGETRDEGHRYRPAVAVMLLNAEGKVFVGQRLDNALDAWQAAGRARPGRRRARGVRFVSSKSKPESGASMSELVARTQEELLYDLPPDLIGKVWKVPWRGQRQTWFLMRFIVTDADVNIQTSDPEFRAWKWADPADLPAMIVPFKKKLYEDVLEAFAEWL